MVVVFFKVLLREWEYRAVLTQELANMASHGIDVEFACVDTPT